MNHNTQSSHSINWNDPQYLKRLEEEAEKEKTMTL
jgi:hypothetical protein